MSSQPPFDVEQLGLKPYYSERDRLVMRRLVLEDLRQAGVKLPTYMKLLARFISTNGLPEEWLGKLIHQTMDKMLKGTATPRYEFWACLHMYFMKRHADADILEPESAALRRFGIALTSFTTPVSSASMLADGAYYVTGAQMAVYVAVQETFLLIRGLQHSLHDPERLAEACDYFEGIGLISADNLVTVLRDHLTHAPCAQTFPLSQLSPLRHSTLRNRLERYAGASAT